MRGPAATSARPGASRPNGTTPDLASPRPNGTIPALLASPGAASKTPKATSRSLCRADTSESQRPRPRPPPPSSSLLRLCARASPSGLVAHRTQRLRRRPPLVRLRGCAEWLPAGRRRGGGDKGEARCLICASVDRLLRSLYLLRSLASSPRRQGEVTRSGQQSRRQQRRYHGRALLPRAPAPGVLLPHRQDPLRAARAHRRHPDAAHGGGGDERGRVAAERQDDGAHSAAGVRDRRVRQDRRHPPPPLRELRPEAVAGGLQGAAPPGAPPHARAPQRRGGVPEGQGRHRPDGLVPAHRRERLQLGPDGEEQVGAGAHAAGARAVPGGGARKGAQDRARDQGLRQLQPQQRVAGPGAASTRSGGRRPRLRPEQLAVRGAVAPRGRRPRPRLRPEQLVAAARGAVEAGGGR